MNDRPAPGPTDAARHPVPIVVLILEDNPSDAELMTYALKQSGYEPNVQRVDNEREFLARLDPNLDLIISDYSLPQYSGLHALRSVRGRGLDIPFILVSGSIGEEIAVAAMHGGADDYLLKDRMARLGAAVQQAIGRRQLRREAGRAEIARRESDERFRQIADNIRDVFWLADVKTGRCLYVSPAYELIWERPRDNPIDSPQGWLDTLHPEDRAILAEAAFGNRAGSGFDVQYRIARPDGSLRWIHDRAFAVHDASGAVYRVAGIAEDITDQKTAELRIRGLNRVHAMLSAVNSLIVREQDRQALFDGACRIAVELGEFGLAWIGAFDAERMIVTPLAVSGAEDSRFVMEQPAYVGEDGSNADGVIARAVRERRTIVDGDIAAAPERGGERRKEAVRRGYRSVIALPLLVEGSIFGTFAIFAKSTNFFDNEEVRLLTELAGNIAFALDHMTRQKNIEKLSRVRAVSSRINAAIVRIREREALLQETCRIAAEHGRFPFVWIGEVDREARRLRPIAAAGFSTDTVDSIDWNTAVQAQGSLHEAIHSGRVVVRNDLRMSRPTARLREEALAGGCHSMVTLPLQVDGQVVGLILLGATERDFFDQDELLLLDEVSADVSFALQTIVEHERVEYLSYYDPLTGLPNRALLIDRVGQTMRARRDEDAPLALVLLNIERFRNINETFSRHGGDQLLRQIAQRLETALGGKDHLARIGADAFGVMIPGMGDAARLAQTVEERILGCFREPFVLDADEVRVAAQAGIASFPADADSSESLFGNAEAALKRARDHGDRYLFYTVEMNAKAAHILTLETQLRKAVEEEQFVLHYQPKIDLATGSISGLEALLRWQHPQSGLVPPAQFIPLLEETGLILEAGRWALERAMADHRRWSCQGLDPPRVAVNVSAIQLRRQDFVQTVFAAVQKDDGRPDCLEVEITESLLMQDIQSSIRKLSLLRDLDIHIAMDDFGTGYSSLSYLARLPISSVKIDRSFVSAMHTSPQDMSIVATIVTLTRSLSIKVVAEGVETPEQHAALKDMGCNEAQGYLFSRPVPADEIAILLRNDAVDCTFRNVGAGSQ